MNQIDTAIFRWVNSWAASSPLLVQQMVALRAWLLPWLFVAGLAAFALAPLFVRKYRAYAEKNVSIVICSILSVGVARFVIVEVLRWFIERPRPFEVLDGVIRLIPFVSDGSFPSGHAAAFFALAAPFAFSRSYPKTAFLFFIAAFVISIDRVLGGVHWPSDIMAGAAIGIGTAWFICWSARKRGFLD